MHRPVSDRPSSAHTYCIATYRLVHTGPLLAATVLAFSEITDLPRSLHSVHWRPLALCESFPCAGFDVFLQRAHILHRYVPLGTHRSNSWRLRCSLLAKLLTYRSPFIRSIGDRSRSVKAFRVRVSTSFCSAHTYCIAMYRLVHTGPTLGGYGARF